MQTNQVGIKRLRLLTLALTISYPIALHLAIIQGYAEAAVWILLIISLAHSLLVFRATERKRLTELLAPGVAVLSAVSLFMNDASILYLPPMLIASSLLILFGRTLMPGEEPLISQFARRVEGEGNAAVLVYTRRLTWVWTLFFVAMLIESLLLALLAPIEVWSLFTNLINYLLIAGLFLLELVFRVFYFRRLPSISTLKQLFRRAG